MYVLHASLKGDLVCAGVPSRTHVCVPVYVRMCEHVCVPAYTCLCLCALVYLCVYVCACVCVSYVLCTGSSVSEHAYERE